MSPVRTPHRPLVRSTSSCTPRTAGARWADPGVPGSRRSWPRPSRHALTWVSSPSSPRTAHAELGAAAVIAQPAPGRPAGRDEATDLRDHRCGQEQYDLWCEPRLAQREPEEGRPGRLRPAEVGDAVSSQQSVTGHRADATAKEEPVAAGRQDDHLRTSDHTAL